MAEGSQILTTYYAKRIMGDTAAAIASKALLQTGENIVTDTWILHRSNRNTKLYGIKYVYNSSDHDKIEFYGASTAVESNATPSAWVQLDTGDAYFMGNVGIGTDTLSYKLSVNGTSYFSDVVNIANQSISSTQGSGSLIIGSTSGKNISIDEDEIIARDYASNAVVASNLNLNVETASTTEHLSTITMGNSGDNSGYVSIQYTNDCTSTSTGALRVSGGLYVTKQIRTSDDLTIYTQFNRANITGLSADATRKIDFISNDNKTFARLAAEKIYTASELAVQNLNKVYISIYNSNDTDTAKAFTLNAPPSNATNTNAYISWTDHYIGHEILPYTHNSYNIGDASYRWKTLYLGTSFYIGPTTYTAWNSAADGIWANANEIGIQRTKEGGGFYLESNGAQVGRYYLETQGTTSAQGYARITLGNNKAHNVAENAKGRILLYGTDANYALIEPGALTSDITLGATADTFTMPKLNITSTQDSGGTSDLSGDTRPALVIGSITDKHLEICKDEIMAKATANTVSSLYLNYNGGNISMLDTGTSYSVNIRSTKGATSATAAALTVGGGAGINEKLYVTGNLYLGAGSDLMMNYNSTYYDVVSNYNNKNVVLTACTGGLYIGYTNTAGTYIYYSTSSSAGTKFFEVNSNGSYALTRFGVNGQNTSYNLYVNGSTLHNGTVYFANGTTYYIDNSAKAYFGETRVTYLTVNAAHQTDWRLYVNGTVASNTGVRIIKTAVDLKSATNAITSNSIFYTYSQDKNGYVFGTFECGAETDGDVYAYFGVNNRDTSGTAQGWKGIKITSTKGGVVTYSVADGAAFRSAIGVGASGTHADSYFVKTTGDTMSGYLSLQIDSIDASKTNNNISSTQYPTTFNILDSAGRIMCRMEGVIQASGAIRSYWYVRNYNTSGTQTAQKGIWMEVANDGTMTYSVSDADKFRSAISAPSTTGTNASGTWDINITGTVNNWTFGIPTSLNANDVRTSNGLWAVNASITNAAQTNHSLLLGVSHVGTPFQIQIPDSSHLYIYKRWYSSSAWSAWSKISAGYADTAGSSASCTGNAASATKLAHTTLDSTTINNTAGSFAFSGSGAPWAETDWVGLQIGDSVDKFQISANGNTLVFRQNDSGGTNTSWSDWVTMLTSANYKTYCTPANIGAATSGHNHNSTYLKLDGSNTMTGTINSTAGTGMTIKPASARAYLQIIPQGDYEADLAFGRSNAKTWSLSARNSTDTFFGLYNHNKSNWAIKFAYSDNTVTLATALPIASGGTGKTTAADAWTALGGGASGKHADSYFALSGHTHGWANLTDNANSLSAGTSDLCDGAEILTSYASGNGFADTNAKGKVYRRNVTTMYNYIKSKASGSWGISITGSSASCTGNAATATTLKTARNLWGNSFNGSAAVDGTITFGDEKDIIFKITRKKAGGGGWAYTPIQIKDNAGTDFAHFGVYGGANALTYIFIGSNGYDSTANLRIDGSGNLTAPKFTGAVVGNVTGNCSGSSGSCTGNAASATQLKTARTIWGQSFDGTANITGNFTTSNNVYAHRVWANQGTEETRLAVDHTTAGNLYLWSNSTNKGLYSGSGYKTGNIIKIDSGGVNFYGTLTGNATGVLNGGNAVVRTSNDSSYVQLQTTSRVLRLQADGNLVVYEGSTPKWSAGTGSSRLIKQNIYTISDSEINKFMKIRPVSFIYRPEMGYEDILRYGVIAEELLLVYPNLVDIPNNYSDETFDIKKGMDQPLITVKYDQFIPLLIKMVQNQQREIEQLRKQINKRD